MKQLPVIQPSGPSASASRAGEAVPASERRPLQTAEMVDHPEKSAELKPQIVAALSRVFDPEIPVNIYDLGLIYDVVVEASGAAGIRMTLTAPACPAAQFLPEQVRQAVAAVPGVTDVRIDVVWEPPWTRERMSDAARLQLGMF